MRTLAVFFIFVAIPLANGTFRPIREADFWRPLALDLSFASRFLSDEFCHSDPKYMQACLTALRSMGQNDLGGDPSVITVKKALERIDRMTRNTRSP